MAMFSGNVIGVARNHFRLIVDLGFVHESDAHAHPANGLINCRKL